MRHLKKYEELKQIGHLKWPNEDKKVKNSADYLDYDVVELYYKTIIENYGGKGYKAKMRKPKDVKETEWMLNVIDKDDEDRPMLYKLEMYFYPYELTFQLQKRDEYEIFLYVKNLDEKDNGWKKMDFEAIYELSDPEKQMSDVVDLINKNIKIYSEKCEDFIKFNAENNPQKIVDNKVYFMNDLVDKYNWVFESDELGLL